jgi:hypothetical protein
MNGPFPVDVVHTLRRFYCSCILNVFIISNFNVSTSLVSVFLGEFLIR